jgi:hypothetical protein
MLVDILNLQNLIAAQKIYIQFLGDEINRTASFLHIHRMTPPIEIIHKGIELRKQIEQLEQQIKE